MSARKLSVLCRGTCKNGHVVEANSDPGRVTWKGQCPEDGCDDTAVFARRASGAHSTPARAVPAAHPDGEDPPKPAAKKTAAKKTASGKTVRVEDWSDPNDDPRPATGRRARATRAKTGHASQATGSAAPAPGARATKRAAAGGTGPAGGAGGTGAGGGPGTGAGGTGDEGNQPSTQGGGTRARSRELVGRARGFFGSDRTDSIYDGIY